MTCKHCKYRIRTVTMDDKLGKMIDLQAKKLHNREETIKHMVRLIVINRETEALELGLALINSQSFKG